jgi:O-antigen ligase
MRRVAALLGSSVLTLPRAALIALVLAAGAHAVVPAGPLQIGLAVVAFALFARDRRHGILGAAVVVLLALPYDRAANSELLRIASIPVRPHDVVVGLALLGALPGLRRLSFSATSLALGAFLLAGVVALALGFIVDNEPRDILRDARWWFLYGIGLLAIGLPGRRAQIVRGMLVGATAFAVVAVLVTILPAFEDGLKYRSLIYDLPALRMQFGNSAFLMPAACYVGWRWVRRPSWATSGWFLLIFAALALSLTRVLILLALGSLVLALIWWWRSRSAPGRRAVALLGMAVAGLALGIAINVANPLVGDLVGIESPVESGGVFDRLTFGGGTGADAIASGRLETYAEAISRTRTSPVIGLGMGALIDVDYEFGGDEFATPGKLPNVDNAYLTVGLKAGAVGIATLALLLLRPLAAWRRRQRDRLTRWLLPGWLGILGLTMTQSFATNGYSPFVLSLLIVVLGVGYASSRRARAVDQR